MTWIEKLKNFRQEQKAQAGMVGLVVSVLVTIVIGILVFWKITGSISTGASTGAGGLVQAQVNTTAGTIFSLMPIVAIVLIAGIILSVVSGFGKSGGQ